MNPLDNSGQGPDDMMDQNNNQPLHGMRVLDFGTLLPGPLASLILAGAGADVIKVEMPLSGDFTRGMGPGWGRDSVYFHMLNAGKKTIAADLKTEAGRARIAPLVETADVIIDQFRPGVMGRLGLGYEGISELNPGVIYCSITGYGQSGPKAMQPGHDINYMAETGLLALSMGEGGHEVMPPALVGDIAGGTYPAVMNILLAYIARGKDGKGRHLDISMSDNLFPIAWWALGEGQARGRWPGNSDSLLTGGSPRYQLYRTRDDGVLAVGALEDKFWAVFCELAGIPVALGGDTVSTDEAIAQVAEVIAGRTAEEWGVLLENAECCCSVVRGLQEGMEAPHFQARGLFDRQMRNEVGDKMAALPLPIDESFRDGSQEISGVPELGSSDAAVCDWEER